MKIGEKMKLSNFKGNWSVSMLKKVVSDLKEGSDIEGAVLVGGNDTVITFDLPENGDYKAEIPEILALLEDQKLSPADEHRDCMFMQSILDYNGCRILAQKLKNNLTLLVMLQKQGYVGLAMLDIENSIRRIQEILGENDVREPNN